MVRGGFQGNGDTSKRADPNRPQGKVDDVHPGAVIEVFWPHDDEWYRGTVKSIDAKVISFASESRQCLALDFHPQGSCQVSLCISFLLSIIGSCFPSCSSACAFCMFRSHGFLGIQQTTVQINYLIYRKDQYLPAILPICSVVVLRNRRLAQRCVGKTRDCTQSLL
jgi:hypothetical protein